MLNVKVIFGTIECADEGKGYWRLLLTFGHGVPLDKWKKLKFISWMVLFGHLTQTILFINIWESCGWLIGYTNIIVIGIITVAIYHGANAISHDWSNRLSVSKTCYLP